MSKNLSIGQRLFAHGGVYVASKAVNIGIGTVLLPIYVTVLSPHEFGIVKLMETIGLCLGYVFCQGLVNAWNRLRFKEPDAENVRVLESTILWYLIATLPLAVGLLWLTAPFVEWIYPDIPFNPYWMLTAPAVALMTFASLYENRLQMTQRPFAYALFSGFRNLLIPLMIILFIVGFDRGAVGKMEADLLAAILLAGFAFWMLKPGSPRRFSVEKIRASLAYSLPLAPHVMAVWTNDFLDRTLVANLMGLSATAVYSVGCQYPIKLFLVTQALNKSLTPLFISSARESELAKERGETDKAQRGMEALARMVLLTITVLAAMAVGMTAVIREVLYGLTIWLPWWIRGENVDPAFMDAWTVAAPTAAGMVALTGYYVFTHGALYDARGSRKMILISGLAAAVNFGVNVWLIPRWGMMGAALATLLSNVIMAGMCLRLSLSILPVPYAWGRWARMLAAFAVGITTLWLLDRFMDHLAGRLVLKALVGFGTVWMMAHGAGIQIREFRDFGKRLKTKADAMGARIRKNRVE